MDHVWTAEKTEILNKEMIKSEYQLPPLNKIESMAELLDISIQEVKKKCYLTMFSVAASRQGEFSQVEKVKKVTGLDDHDHDAKQGTSATAQLVESSSGFHVNSSQVNTVSSQQVAGLDVKNGKAKVKKKKTKVNKSGAKRTLSDAVVISDDDEKPKLRKPKLKILYKGKVLGEEAAVNNNNLLVKKAILASCANSLAQVTLSMSKQYQQLNRDREMVATVKDDLQKLLEAVNDS